MAAALLVWSEAGVDAQLRTDFDRVAQRFPPSARTGDSTDHEDHRLLLRVWHGPVPAQGNFHSLPAGGVLAFVGNPTPAPGSGSLASLAERCASAGAKPLDLIWPPFAAFLRDARDDSLTVAVDRAGLQHVYVREHGGATWAGTSAFALATLGADLDAEAAAEWLSVGHFLGDKTFFRGIRQLSCGERLELRPRAAPRRFTWEPASSSGTSPAEYQQALIESVRAYSAEPEGLFFELTGGLDTRVLLAAGLRGGAKAMKTWTIGRPDDVEMRTIRRLRRVAPFDHLLLSPDDSIAGELPELAAEMHTLADGEANALAYTSLLVAFRGLAGVRRTSVTGSGGEVARGFYWRALARREEPHRRGVSLERLIGRVTRDSGSIPGAIRRDVVEIDALLHGLLETFVSSSPLQTPHAILDDFYLRTRMRRFAGRNITTTGLFCLQAVPFFSHHVTDCALALPVDQKRDSRAIREAVAAFHPGLAAVPLASGGVVPPLSYRHPFRAVRRAAGLGRKGISRYGGALGRRIVHAPEPSMPWQQIASDAQFREYVGDLLLAREARTASLLERQALTSLVEGGLADASLYPLGLVLTVELTLRKFGLTV